jgi:hypothetical protein
VTHDQDQEHTAEVISGPGGPGRDHKRGVFLRDQWQRQSTRARTVTAAITVAVLAACGTAAYAATSGNSGNDPATATPAAGSASASPSPDGPGPRHGRGMWFGLGGDAAHGEATVKDRDSGEWVVRIWQRGTVEKIDGDQVTVKSEDGAEWTWTVDADTTLYRGGSSGSGADDLKKGETAYLVGSRSDDGTRTATHALSGTWEKREKRGPGDWRGHFPGQGHRGGDDRGPGGPGPSADPSGSGTAT